jgi:hypothetical protein
MQSRAWKYINLRPSAMRRLPEDGQVGPKHVAIDVILILLRLSTFLSSIKGGECVIQVNSL